jgi:hypothetical protein
MRSLHILTVAFLVILLSATNVHAQPGNAIGLGLRASPDGGGITAKFYLDRYWNIEAQLNASQGFYHGPDNKPDYGPSFTAVGLAEYNVIFPDPSWRLFFGPGIHFGSWDRYNHHLYERQPLPEAIFGIDGILGVEYIFRHIPLGLSADIKPAMNFVGEVSVFPNNFFGLSGRFYFGRPMVTKKKVRVRVD